MSLLIKALDKAQEAKAQTARVKQAEQAVNSDNTPADKPIETNIEPAAKRQPQNVDSDIIKPAVNAATAKLAAANALEMELSPLSNKNADNPDIFPITSTVKSLESTLASDTSAKNAANVFAAKRIESNNQKTILALVLGVGICILLAVAAYFYLFMQPAPEFVARRPVPLAADTTEVKQLPVKPSAELLADELRAPVTAIETQSTPAASQATNALTLAEKPVNESAKAEIQNDKILSENEVLIDEFLVEKTANNEFNQVKQTKPDTLNVEEIASKSASIQVSKTRPQTAVNPVLMDAFNAYNTGNDAVAGKLYRQVLQRDVRNVDALLGLGAIAQRQGRLADANGWYGKVLEVEPRNVLATTAILGSQPQSDVTSRESRIKNMLAKQPEDANLHATLGNFYADLNQWPAAQQAYFDAYRLNASADNAFNLAVSLDQLNKPKLALPYYQQAIQLMETSASNIDKSALQARIMAIQ